MNRSPAPAQSNRQVWLIIFGALVCSVLIYGLLCFFLEHSKSPRTTNPASLAQLRPFIIGLAVIMLIASVAWLRFKVDGKIGGEGRPVTITPPEFQSDSIVALALSEACAIFGLMLFFLGAPLQEFAFFAAGTLLVDFAFILPRGLQFWSAMDGRGNF
ncbi:hypothetical protein EON83_03330 [bacterium]|nr:MAG: hypothetical protein EON83_03330 [bacterium]